MHIPDGSQIMIRSQDHLVSHLSTQFGLSEDQAAKTIQGMLDWIMNALKEGMKFVC